jgi:hypothetical protein
MIKKTIVVFLFIMTSVGIFAQSKDATDQAMTNDGTMPALSPTQSDPVNDIRPQIITTKRYMEYLPWFAKNVCPLSKEAEKKGLQATQEELSVQEKAFNAMFPGIPSTPSDRSNEILAQKYSKTLPGTFTSTGDIHNAYTQLQSEFPNEHMPSLDNVRPMLEMRALLENRSVQIQVEKRNEQIQKEQNDSIINAFKTWPISDLTMHAPGNNCLARNIDNDSCLLTVEKFNRYIRYMEVPKVYSIDSARMQAIKEILRELFIADEARNQQAEESDTIANKKQNWIQEKMFQIKFKNLSMPVRDSNALHDAFSTYYDAFFSERVFPYYSIIGSSDSLYMDSVSQALQCDTLKNGKNSDNKSKAMNHASGFSWSYSRADFLPEEFDKYIDTMRLKDVSGIIKTPYGFFIVRFDSMQIRPALRFEDAQNDLIFLATKRKWEDLDSSLAARAYRIYTLNKRLNQTADTLRIMAFLTPLNDQPAVSTGGKGPLKSKNKKASKEGLEKGLTVLSTQLPSDIRDSLLNRFEAGNGKNQILGPIASRYGVWNFKVLDIFHGGGILPFSFSKKRLIDSMVVSELELTLDAQWLKPDSALDDLALAKSYAPAFFGFHDTGKKDRDTSERNASHDAVANAGNDNTNLKRMKKFQSSIAELEAWFSKLSIHL